LVRQTGYSEGQKLGNVKTENHTTVPNSVVAGFV